MKPKPTSSVSPLLAPFRVRRSAQHVELVLDSLRVQSPCRMRSVLRDLGVLLPLSQLDKVQLLGIGEAFSGKPGFHLWDITLRSGTECGEVTLETPL